MRNFQLKPFQKTSIPLAVWLEKPSVHNFHERLHTHDCYELMFMVEGTGWCAINGRHYPMQKGAVFLMMPEDTHEFLTRKGVRFFNVMFSKDLFSEDEAQFFEGLLARPGSFLLSPMVSQALSEILAEVSRELSRRSSGAALVAHALMVKCLVQVCRCSNRINGEDRSHHEMRTAQLLSRLNQAYNRKLTLDDLASELQLSAGYLSRQIRQITGVSFTDYIRNCRIEQAQALLENTNSPISEIAFNLGYFDTPHFDKQFRKVVGISPLEYRKAFS